MSIDNISRIDAKGGKNKIYLFDIPSIEDADATVTYLLIVSKDGEINIQKLTDFNGLFDLLHNSRTVSIKYQSKEYRSFIEKMSTYMDKVKENNNTTLDNDDIDIINHQYERELRKKGNTDILKRVLKKEE